MHWQEMHVQPVGQGYDPDSHCSASSMILFPQRGRAEAAEEESRETGGSEEIEEYEEIEEVELREEAKDDEEEEEADREREDEDAGEEDVTTHSVSQGARLLTRRFPASSSGAAFGGKEKNCPYIPDALYPAMPPGPPVERFTEPRATRSCAVLAGER